MQHACRIDLSHLPMMSYGRRVFLFVVFTEKKAFPINLLPLGYKISLFFNFVEAARKHRLEELVKMDLLLFCLLMHFS